MERIPLYEEYRLIERSDAEINGAWKGGHLLLFFLAFVFGSFCTFSFHMLIYLFEEKCVLYPKLISLSEQRHSVVYDFVPDKATAKAMPVDFVSAQWVENSVCYLPMYVPLMSGICGLILTAMVLMCSSANHTLTGLRSSRRILPPIFVFSLIISIICIYSSAITHSGLNELCVKLGEITGSSACSYVINVATLPYEHQIRGVHQAIRMTILTAWLHTLCWLLAAALVVLRILLVVDFRLVRVQVELHGDIEKILEHHERHIRTVSPEMWARDNATNTRSAGLVSPADSIKIHYKNEGFNATRQPVPLIDNEDTVPNTVGGDSKAMQRFASPKPTRQSSWSLVPDELHKLGRITAYDEVDKKYRFIVKLLFDIMDEVLETSTTTDSKFLMHDTPWSRNSISPLFIDDDEVSDSVVLPRRYGQQEMATRSDSSDVEAVNQLEADEGGNLTQSLSDPSSPFSSHNTDAKSSPIRSSKDSRQNNDSKGKSIEKKSNLKNRTTQTDSEKLKQHSPQRVHIADSKTHWDATVSEETLKPKELEIEDDMKHSIGDKYKEKDKKDEEPKNSEDSRKSKKEKQD